MFGNDGSVTRTVEPYMPPVSGTTILVFVVVFVATYFALRPILLKKRGGCRWRRQPEANRPPFTKWQCKACFTEAYSTDRRPPKECKRLVNQSLRTL